VATQRHEDAGGAPAVTGGPHAGHLDDLAAALRDETRVVEALRAALLRQRSGIAGSDYAAVEDSVRAMSRIALTLDEARTRRLQLTTTITGGHPAPLGELERYLGHRLPDPLPQVRASLRAAAAAVAHDIRINQRILRRALDAGDEFLQRLFTAAAPPNPVYRPGDSPAARPVRDGVLVNRTV
jgi:hypothetical protein